VSSVAHQSPLSTARYATHSFNGAAPVLAHQPQCPQEPPRPSVQRQHCQRTLHILEHRHEFPLVWNRAVFTIGYTPGKVGLRSRRRHECMYDLARPCDTHDREHGACAVSACQWGRDCLALAPDTCVKFKRQTHSERGGEPWKDECSVTVYTEASSSPARAYTIGSRCFSWIDRVAIVRRTKGRLAPEK